MEVDYDLFSESLHNVEYLSFTLIVVILAAFLSVVLNVIPPFLAFSALEDKSSALLILFLLVQSMKDFSLFSWNSEILLGYSLSGCFINPDWDLVNLFTLSAQVFFFSTQEFIIIIF